MKTIVEIIDAMNEEYQRKVQEMLERTQGDPSKLTDDDRDILVFGSVEAAEAWSQSNAERYPLGHMN